MNKLTNSSLTQQARHALTDAVAKVVEDHRRRAKPLAVWRDGKAVWLPAAEAGALHETSISSVRTRSTASQNSPNPIRDAVERVPTKFAGSLQ